jgi:hypothetical protein
VVTHNVEKLTQIAMHNQRTRLSLSPINRAS